MDKNYLFYVGLAVVFVVGDIVARVAAARKAGKQIDLPSLVENAVFAAEQLIPGSTGADKKAWVLGQLKLITKIDDSQMAYIELMIEAAVKKFKLSDFMPTYEVDEPITSGVTEAGQESANELARKDLI